MRQCVLMLMLKEQQFIWIHTRKSKIKFSFWYSLKKNAIFKKIFFVDFSKLNLANFLAWNPFQVFASSRPVPSSPTNNRYVTRHIFLEQSLGLSYRVRRKEGQRCWHYLGVWQLISPQPCSNLRHPIFLFVKFSLN